MMTTAERLVSDQLLARVECVAERLACVERELRRLTQSARSPFERRCRQAHRRCQALGGHIMGWPQIRPDTAAAVEELARTVDALEADLVTAMEPHG